MHASLPGARAPCGPTFCWCIPGIFCNTHIYLLKTKAYTIVTIVTIASTKDNLDLDLMCFRIKSSGKSSGFLKGPLVQKIRYFKTGSGFGSKDLDLLTPSVCTWKCMYVWCTKRTRKSIDFAIRREEREEVRTLKWGSLRFFLRRQIQGKTEPQQDNVSV